MREFQVMGSIIDEETRCKHYNSKVDIIAIKFHCCKMYFPCYSCHEESGCGTHKVWPKDQFNEKAVLCGICKHEMTIEEYKNSQYKCPSCHAEFNPGCGLHWELYFEN
ncbi:CHY zinc finger protein [Sporosarcina contaminans]|uniref:CHY zinc finger protein n=1 Tax=Sporosarcina contaminans TaxID=633403 RepID=A0ABW3TV34_9BACL